MIISQQWCSERRKPGDEMFSNTGFAAMAAIGKRLEDLNLLPTKIIVASGCDDPVYRVTHYMVAIETMVDPAPGGGTGGSPRQPFWQWYLENKPPFTNTAERSAEYLQSVEDETQMDPVKLFA